MQKDTKNIRFYDILLNKYFKGGFAMNPDVKQEAKLRETIRQLISQMTNE